MNVPHAFSLSLTLSLSLSLSHTHKHTYVCMYIYIYIHIYISYLQLSNKSPIPASRNGGGRWVIRWQQQQMQKQSPHGNHMCTSHTVQAYQKLQPSYHSVWLWTVSRYNKYIHVTAIAQSNVYRSEHNSIILNVILTLILRGPNHISGFFFLKSEL
jgi:hypothetical protein